MTFRLDRSTTRNAIGLPIIALALMLAACGTSTAVEGSIVTDAEEAVVPADIATCLTINPGGPVTTPPGPQCQAHGDKIVGFHEAAALMEWVDYRPLEAGVIAVEIRRVVDEFDLYFDSDDYTYSGGVIRSERSFALEAIAEIYEQMEIDFSVRVEGATSSRASDAAYVEIFTRDAWVDYFLTFFEGRDRYEDADELVELMFVRIRGFELEGRGSMDFVTRRAQMLAGFGQL